MITKFLIILIVGIVATTLFVLFVNNKKILKLVATIVFVIYLSMLVVGVFSNDSNLSKISFEATQKWASKQIDWSPMPNKISDFFINIIMLIPIGLYLGIMCKKPLIKSIVIGFCVGFFIEFMQFVLPISRSPQLSDMLLNGLSSVLGCLYIMLIMWTKQKNRKKKHTTVVNENINSKTTLYEKEQEPIRKN